MEDDDTTNLMCNLFDRGENVNMKMMGYHLGRGFVDDVCKVKNCLSWTLLY